MRDLQEATERICELKGNLVALDALLTAIVRDLPAERRVPLSAAFDQLSEVARTVLLHAPISDLTVAAFERDVARFSERLTAPP